MSILHMVRHGQASFGMKSYDSLSELGVLQSRVLADDIVTGKTRFSMIYVGAMMRHRETLDALMSVYEEKGIAPPPVRQTDEFNEYSWTRVVAELFPQLVREDPALQGDATKIMNDEKTFRRIFEGAILRWVSGNQNSPDLPKWEDFLSRVHGGIERIMKEHGSGEEVAVFTSAGPISAAVQKVLGISGEDTVKLSWMIINGSVTRFKFTNDSIMLLTFNEHAHLSRYTGKNIVTFR